MFFHVERTIWSMYFVVSISEVTAHAPHIHPSSVVLLEVLLQRAFATVRSRKTGEFESSRGPPAHGHYGVPSCETSWWADKFSRSSQSAMSMSPDQSPSARDTEHMKIPRSIFLPRLMQPRLVFREDGFAAGVCPERDQRSVKLYNNYFLVCCLAIGHIVVHIPQGAVTFHHTVPSVIG